VRCVLPPAEGVGSGIESVVLLIAVGAVLARKRRRWKRASRWQSSILRLAIGVQGGVPKDRIAIRPKPSRTVRLEVGRPGRLGWVCSKAGRAAVDPRGFSCVVGGWPASAEGEMTSSRGNRRVFYWEEGWLGWEHKHTRGAVRAILVGRERCQISSFYLTCGVSGLGCVFVSRPREERAAESNRVRGGREHPGRHPRPGDKGANAWR
jgi:hypothetical protein